MARTAITPTQVIMTGVAQPNQTVGIADGHKFRNNGRVMVEINNTHDAPLKFTFQTPVKRLGVLSVAELEITVAAGAFQYAGPFPPGTFNQGNDEVYLDYDVAQFAKQKVRVLQLSE